MYTHNGRKLNILFVFGGEKAQGAEIVIERMMMQIADKYNLHLILSPGNFADTLKASKKPYRIQTLDDLRKLNRSSSSKLKFYQKAAKNYLSVPKAINQYINNNSIDVVHANTLVPSAYMIPLVLLKETSVKWLWSDHDMAYFSRLDRTLASLCVALYNRTLLVSSALKKKYNAHSQKLSVFYNGLDTDFFKVDLNQRIAFRKQWSFQDDEKLIVIAGSINPDKGQLELIEVFGRLSQRFEKVKLVIAGNFAEQFPDYKVQVTNAIAAQPGVVYIGFTANTTELYNGCDILVNNSNNVRSESLGTTIYEAMACEKIVVASRTGGTPEIIEDNVEGFLFNTEDAVDLEEKLSYVLENYTSLDVIRSAARQKVLKRFDIRVMAGNYHSVLRDLIANN